MKNKLFLFDIDGTLLSPGPAARIAISKAIENYTGIPPKLQIQDVAGLTDKLIVKNAVYKVKNENISDEQVNRILFDYIKLFKSIYDENNSAFIYKDAIALIDKVIKHNNSIGLLTGNIKEGAEIKLKKFNLMKYFPFGVYAENGETRNELPKVAQKLAKHKLGIEYRLSSIVLVGDTPEDARAARLSGCESVIVCRRVEWREQIAEEGANLIVDSLDSPEIDQKYFN